MNCCCKELHVTCDRDADNTTQKMQFSIKNFFRKCDQIRSLLRIWSHLLKKSLMENVIFCVCSIKDSADNLKLCRGINFFTNLFVRVWKSCKKSMRYLIYNRLLFEFTHNLAKSFKKNHTFKIARSSLQLWLKTNSFTD